MIYTRLDVSDDLGVYIITHSDSTTAQDFRSSYTDNELKPRSIHSISPVQQHGIYQVLARCKSHAVALSHYIMYGNTTHALIVEDGFVFSSKLHAAQIHNILSISNMWDIVSLSQNSHQTNEYLSDMILIRMELSHVSSAPSSFIISKDYATLSLTRALFNIIRTLEYELDNASMESIYDKTIYSIMNQIKDSNDHKWYAANPALGFRKHQKDLFISDSVSKLASFYVVAPGGFSDEVGMRISHVHWKDYIQTVNVTDVFQSVYNNKEWGDYGGGSGIGSSDNFTESLIKSLPKLLIELNVNSFIDISCGSFSWMNKVVKYMIENNESFRYTGYDVACQLIDKHKDSYNYLFPFVDFKCIDVVTTRLPAADVIFARHTLSHWPYEFTYKFLRNVKSSGSKFLLVDSMGINYPTNMNRRIFAGEFYLMDITKDPFQLRPVKLIIEDGPDGENKNASDSHFMLLYDIENMEWNEYA
jgi:hypothetical protein